MGLMSGCRCRCSNPPPPVIYRDSFVPFGANRSDFEAALSTPTTLLPTVASDLDDCDLYVIGLYRSSGYTWHLSSTNETVISDWVNAGGKLIIAADYKDFYINGVFNNEFTRSAWFDGAELFIGLLGGSMSYGRQDSDIADGVIPWPLGTFLSKPITSGITGSFEYDSSAGTSMSFSGTNIFTSTENDIAIEVYGDGAVMVCGSHNILLGNMDRDQSTATDFAAMGELLNNFVDMAAADML